LVEGACLGRTTGGPQQAAVLAGVDEIGSSNLPSPTRISHKVSRL